MQAAQIAESTNSYSTAKASSSSSTVAAPNMYPGYASATIQPPAAFSAFNTSQYPTQSTYPAYGTFPGMMAIPPVTTPDLANATVVPNFSFFTHPLSVCMTVVDSKVLVGNSHLGQGTPM